MLNGNQSAAAGSQLPLTKQASGRVRESLFDIPDKIQRDNFRIWSKNIPLTPKKTDQRTVEGTLFRRAIKSSLWKQNRYELIGSKLIRFDRDTNKPTRYACIENFRLDKLKLEDKNPEKEARYGFRLTSNGQFVELYARNKEAMQFWFDQLKKQCVLTSFQNDYATIKLMGKGNFARVYYARSKLSGQEFAVKAFDKDKFASIEIDRPALIKEISILRKLNHPGVIKMYEVYENETHIFLINELLKGGELFHKLKSHGKFDEKHVAILITTLLDSIKYIAQRNILHRDIKPENLILRQKNDDTDLCLADFGLADYYDPKGGYMFVRCGTPGYVAPEVLADKLYDFKVDTFSVGVIMFILLTGSSPFKGKSYDEIVIKNYNCTIDFNYKDMASTLSPECHELLTLLLKKDPNERLSASQALNHPWFAKMKQSNNPMNSTELPRITSLSYIDDMVSNDQPVLVRIPPKDNHLLKSNTPLMNSKWEQPSEQLSPNTWKRTELSAGTSRSYQLPDYADSPTSIARGGTYNSSESPKMKTPGGSQYSQPHRRVAPLEGGGTTGGIVRESGLKSPNGLQIIKMQSVPESYDEYELEGKDSRRSPKKTKEFSVQLSAKTFGMLPETTKQTKSIREKLLNM